MNGFKPLLAAEADLKRLKFPLMASPKLDGVRATFQGGRLVTRSLKPIPNKMVNELFKFDHSLDGELVVGDAFGTGVFSRTMKVVSAHYADITGLTFRVFDKVGDEPFHERFAAACELCEYKWMLPVPHVEIADLESLTDYEGKMVDLGYEGIMLRDPYGKYKYGRSTESEGILLKMKRKMTSEARVLGFIEKLHNANEAKINALGYTERSSHQSNMIPMGTLGALAVEDIHTGVGFNMGGFTAADAQEIWNNQPKYLGAVASYEFLPTVKDKPRHPNFKGWRMKEDM